MSREPESGKLDLFEELTVRGFQQPRFGYVDFGQPAVPDLEMRRIQVRDVALENAYKDFIGIESENIPEEK